MQSRRHLLFGGKCLLVLYADIGMYMCFYVWAIFGMFLLTRKQVFQTKPIQFTFWTIDSISPDYELWADK